jgi:hypothetical protein
MNCHEDTKTQSETLGSYFPLCLSVLVAKMFLHKLQRIHNEDY